ncbi:hypothetical protein Sjap_018122 [Stephania japonica]|uniref:Uncharacterized protein n=1 Tax=Stephania japonica TaxID=461633 RepID=A0AAP0NJ09_9MAGN
MTNQIEPSDDSGVAGPRVINAKNFQALTQRVATQNQRLEEILRILRRPVATTPSPTSTSGVSATQEMNTSIVATSTAPATIAVIPDTVVLPPIQAEVVPAVPLVQTNIMPTPMAERGIRAITEARLLHPLISIKEYLGNSSGIVELREDRRFAINRDTLSYEYRDRVDTSKGKELMLGDILSE